MSVNDKNSKNYKNLAQLLIFTEEYLDRKYAKKILDQGYDINYQAPADNFFKLRKPNLIGSTALHLSMGNKDIFTFLLDNKADFTLKNSKVMTVLHQSISYIYKHYDDNNWLQGRFESKLDNDYAKLVLDTHLKSYNFTNPCDMNGITHLHIACMVNHESAVEFFIRNGVSIDQIINENSPIFSGFSPLHIAVKCNCSEVVDILLKYGADVNLKDAHGKTAVEIGIERNMEIMDWMHSKDSGAYYFLSLHSDILVRENIIKSIINKKHSLINNKFQAVCTFSDTSIVNNFLLQESCDINKPINTKILLWQGYTSLHFAAHFNFDTVKLLLKHGGNIEAQDSHGVTPLDICEGRFRVKDILFIISSHPIWKNIILSDGRTKLTDLLRSMQKAKMLSEFLDESGLDVNTFVPFHSQIWPGLTILHLAVKFTETFRITTEYSPRYDSYIDPENHVKRRCRGSTNDYLERLKICLKRGADVTIQDVEGQTPIIHAFRLNRMMAVKLMLNFHQIITNPIDKDNLSHLYIACYVEEEDVVEKLLSNGAEMNLSILSSFKWFKNEHSFIQRYRSQNSNILRSTPLHISVTRGSIELTSMLLKYEADVNAKDSDGLTPVHKLLCTYRYSDEIFNLLLSSSKIKSCDLICGLNYLHIAVHFGNIGVIERLIDMGVDVNATIKCTDDIVKNYNENSSGLVSFMMRYQGCTPLHINLYKLRTNHGISELFIRHGADIFIRNTSGYNLIHENLKSRWTNGYNDFIVSIVERDESLQKFMIVDSGITMLHIACWKVDISLARDCLIRGDNVNAKVNQLSPIWKGWTPLHVLMIQSADMYIAVGEALNLLQLLIDNGADFSIRNDEMATSLHLTEADEKAMKVCRELHRTYSNSLFTSLLLKHPTSLANNHANIDGISHFHIACLRNDVEAMENFLLNGADINQPVNVFSIKYPGQAPLHLVLTSKPYLDNSSQIAALELLLKYDANVHVKDTYGNTPLHTSVKCNSLCESSLKILVSVGADINAINIFGETPLEILLKSKNATINDIKLFLDHGCRINSFNPISNEGYVSHIFNYKHSYQASSLANSLLKNILNNCNPHDFDSMGRTFIHNMVSTKKSWITDYADILRLLASRECNVDQQDTLGQTALHNAVQFNNHEAVLGLLETGVDINITDTNGKTPLVLCLEHFDGCNKCLNRFHQQYLVKALVTHVYKLQTIGLYVNERNKESKLMKKSVIDKNIIELVRNEIEMAKTIKVASSVTLYDFLSDNGAVATYPIMKYTERNAIDDFFRLDVENLKQKGFKEVIGLLNLQYRKALKRQCLNRQATYALNVISQFAVPELCSRVVLKFLTNEQLESLIEAAVNHTIPETQN